MILCWLKERLRLRISRKRGRSSTLLGAFRLVPNVVRDEEDGMAKRASQAGDAPTTDRTGALCLCTEVNTRGKRRRWTAEQKHQIVAEGMEPGVSAAMVARKHGISRGQFYAWRQQLLLRGALGDGADTIPSSAGVVPSPRFTRAENPV